MQQSSSGVVASIILIVGLAVAFALGIHYVGGGLASTALPAPTATVQPTAVVAPVVTARGGTGQNPAGGRGASGRPTATPTVAPTATATPASAVKVVMSTDEGPGETAVGVTDRFATSVGRVWCVATFPHLRPSDAASFKWMSRMTNALIFNYNVPAVGADLTDISKAAFLYGPLSSGKYACEVWLNGKMAGSAPFTVQ